MRYIKSHDIIHWTLKEQAQLPKNITTADLSFHTHVRTYLLSTNINDLINSFLNDSDSVLEQFDLEIVCLNHTLPAKGVVLFLKPAYIKSFHYQSK